jgi:hypothetical protein
MAILTLRGETRMSFLKNIEEIRARARQKIEEGPVTADYL